MAQSKLAACRRFLPGAFDRSAVAQGLRASLHMTYAKNTITRNISDLAYAVSLRAGQRTRAGRKPLPGAAVRETV